MSGDKSVKRRNINVSTLEKIKNFLKKQNEPVFKSDIVKEIGVDYDSLSTALKMIDHKTDDKGRISLKNA